MSGSASSSSASWADTYYLYDALGRLTVVLPPMLSDAVAASSWSSGSTSAQSKVSSYAYQYRYDARDRVIAKKLPGAQWIYYVYDCGDRLVLTQDGNRRSAGQWQFSLQDQLGRECLNGVITAEYDAFHGYDPVGVSLSGSTILEVSWWDNYGYIGEDSLTPESDCGYESAGESAGYGARYAASAQGLLTGSLTRMLGESGNNEYLWKSVYYNGFEHLDGDGTVLHQETYTYSYDGWGRPKVTTHKLGSGSAVTLRSRTYDMLGREVSDSRNGNTALNTQYTYNVRSYPLSISVGSSGSTFSETLYYESGRNGASVTSPQGCTTPPRQPSRPLIHLPRSITILALTHTALVIQ